MSSEPTLKRVIWFRSAYQDWRCKFGRHPFYGSYLEQDAEDPRLGLIMDELKKWCRN